MSRQFDSIAIVGREDDPRIKEPIRALTDYLTKAGVTISGADQSSDADLLIAIGGDGTMLYASRLVRNSSIPILGINRGRLGFLADVTPEDMLASVEHVLRGEFSTDL